MLLMSNQLPVHERFVTFQGEGCHMGKSAFFLRLLGCPVHCPWCFAEGTRLHTDRGRVDVSGIRIGDLVWSFNEKTQRQEWSKVIGVDQRTVDSYYDLYWREGKHHSVRSRVTGEHPFWVVGKGWVGVKDLVARMLTGGREGDGCKNRNFPDTVMEIDSKAYVSALRRELSLHRDSDTLKRLSIRMKRDNPMFSQEVRSKVSSTLKRKIRSGECPNQLKEMWKRRDFQRIVKDRMMMNNPAWDPVSHSKSCYRPMGMISSIEKFVIGVIQLNSLPFFHNRGEVYIGGRVPDFVCERKRKVIEVTSPDYQDRERLGYHEKNRHHYNKFGYDCLTLYVRRSVDEERRVLEALTEFTHNGREILRKEKVEKPIKVYSIRTENHTFFADGVLTHNCDSAGTWHPNWTPKETERMTYQQILDEVLQSLMDRVVVTGGEPAIYDLSLLVAALHDRGKDVHLETSGGFEIQGMFDWITLSPKKWYPPIKSSLEKAHEFKVIVEEADDIGFYHSLITREVPLGHRPVWLHPEWSKRQDPSVLRAICEAVKEGDNTFRAGWQLHKLYQVDQIDSRTKPLVPLGGDILKGF